MKKKPFVVDYKISGTLHLSSPNRIAVERRAEGIAHCAFRQETP